MKMAFMAFAVGLVASECIAPHAQAQAPAAPEVKYKTPTSREFLFKPILVYQHKDGGVMLRLYFKTLPSR
jgi:hypothetical protein